MGKLYSLHFLAPGIVTMGLLVSLIGLISSDWVHINGAGTMTYENIWKYCAASSGNNNEYTCHYFKMGKSKTIDSVRALMIISIVFYVLTCVIALLAYLYDDKHGVLYSAGAAASSLMEALSIMIGLVVYTVRLKKDYSQFQLDWGYFTCWAAFAILLIGAGSFCFQIVMLKYTKRNTYTPI